jgi:hypothetical protein
MRRKSAHVPVPMTDEEWLRTRPRDRCEAPCCTERGRKRIPEVIDLDRDPLPGLPEMLCLCSEHYQALADRIVLACWGVPPLNVLWRVGRTNMATWYRNERRLTPDEVERWMQTPAARLT